MKVILSRKGFDGSNGGTASPILPDRTMLSLPIPSMDSDTYCDLQYNGKPYSAILRELNPRKTYGSCHIDPDLDATRRVRSVVNWAPGFGQIGAAQAYLMRNVEISTGDLFLFFGNFHFVDIVDGQYTYAKTSGDYYHNHDIQAIWGYLQVDKILNDAQEIKTFYWHPHACAARLSRSTNTLFTAKRRLTFAPDVPGSACLPYAEKRVLTAKGANKATWKENPVYMPDAIIGSRKNSAAGKGVYYAGIWQELGLVECKEAENWAIALLRDSYEP